MNAVALIGFGCVALAAGCGGTKSPTGAGTLRSMAAGAKQGSLVFGSSDYAPGRIRISFLVLRPDGRLVMRRRAQVLVAPSVNDRPFVSVTARLESTTVPGAQVALGGTSRLYVAHADIAKAGQYSILVRPIGGENLVASDRLVVRHTTVVLSVGSRAFPSATPTIASSDGDLHKITTHNPPDRGLLRYSVAASLAAHAPFVLVFASPAICPNRTCGPIVDVVDAVRRQFSRTRVRFIHVEPYRNDNPGLGFNRFAREWRLPAEPFTFLVGRDGRIKGEFEGSISATELSSAVRRELLQRAQG